MTRVRAVLAGMLVAASMEAQLPSALGSSTQADLPPAPGRVVDVGGRRLHLLCSGEGTRIRLDERLSASVPDSVSAEVVAASQESERAFLAKLLATRETGYPLGSRPTVVLTRGDEKNAGREDAHAALAKLSSNSRHSIVVGSGHEIHLFEPSAVITAIADVVRAVRDRSGLPARNP